METPFPHQECPVPPTIRTAGVPSLSRELTLMNYTDCRFLLRNLDVSLVFQANLLSLLIDISGSSQPLTGWFLIGTYIWASLQLFVFQMRKLFFSEESLYWRSVLYVDVPGPQHHNSHNSRGIGSLWTLPKRIYLQSPRMRRTVPPKKTNKAVLFRFPSMALRRGYLLNANSCGC